MKDQKTVAVVSVSFVGARRGVWCEEGTTRPQGQWRDGGGGGGGPELYFPQQSDASILCLTVFIPLGVNGMFALIISSPSVKEHDERERERESFHSRCGTKR